MKQINEMKYKFISLSTKINFKIIIIDDKINRYDWVLVLVMFDGGEWQESNHNGNLMQ